MIRLFFERTNLHIFYRVKKESIYAVSHKDVIHISAEVLFLRRFYGIIIMERSFNMKNEYKITRELMMSWAKEYHLQGAANIVLFLIWCTVGVIGLGMLILLIAVGGDLVNWYLSILFLFLSVFKLFFSRFVAISNRYKLLSKTYGVTEWLRTIDFTDDEIILSDHTSVTRFRYDNIKKIKEKSNVVIIFFNNNLAVRLYKDAFVEGTWKECKEKINSILK